MICCYLEAETPHETENICPGQKFLWEAAAGAPRLSPPKPYLGRWGGGEGCGKVGGGEGGLTSKGPRRGSKLSRLGGELGRLLSSRAWCPWGLT